MAQSALPYEPTPAAVPLVPAPMVQPPPMSQTPPFSQPPPMGASQTPPVIPAQALPEMNSVVPQAYMPAAPTSVPMYSVAAPTYAPPTGIYPQSGAPSAAPPPAAIFNPYQPSEAAVPPQVQTQSVPLAPAPNSM